MLTIFDKRQIYKREIEPLVDEIIKKCGFYQIPFFFTACVKNDEHESLYERDGFLTGSSGIELKDNQIEHHLCVANGFITKPKASSNELTDDHLDYLNIDLD